MAVTLITLGTFFNYKNNGYDVSQYGWLPLASFVFFIIGFAIGFGPIPWLMMGEILPGNYTISRAISQNDRNQRPYSRIRTKIFDLIFSQNQRHGSFAGYGFQLGLHVRRHQDVFRFIASLRYRWCLLAFRRYLLVGISVRHILRARNSRQKSRRYRTEFDWCRQRPGKTSKKNEFHSAFETAADGNLNGNIEIQHQICFGTFTALQKVHIFNENILL